MSIARALAVLLLFAGAACAPKRSEPEARAPDPEPATTTPVPAVEPAPPEVEEPVAAAPVEAEPEEPSLPWPPGVPQLAGARVIETARISANVGESPAGATFVTAKGEVHAVANAWIAAAKAQGLKVLAERALDGVHVASMIDTAGKRSHLLVQTEDTGRSAGVFDVGKHPQVPLRGRCKEAPLRERKFEVDRGAITHDGGYQRGIYPQNVESQIGHDFDGDGELDAIVPTTHRARCPEDVRWTVYLARGACMHEVGTVGPGELITWDLETDKPGPRPIVMRQETNALGDGGVVQTRVNTRYVFDAKKSKYVQSSRTEEKGVCHHCPWGGCKAL